MGHGGVSLRSREARTVRIAITGATGNLGSALLRRLGDQTGPDRHTLVGLARRLPDPGFGGEGTTWVSVDLTEDACVSTLREAFEGADAVVHLAWGFQPSHDQKYLTELGVGGTRRVIEAVTAARSEEHTSELQSRQYLVC